MSILDGKISHVQASIPSSLGRVGEDGSDDSQTSTRK